MNDTFKQRYKDYRVLKTLLKRDTNINLNITMPGGEMYATLT